MPFWVGVFASLTWHTHHATPRPQPFHARALVCVCCMIDPLAHTQGTGGHPTSSFFRRVQQQKALPGQGRREGAPPTHPPQTRHTGLSLSQSNSTHIMSSHLLLLALALCATGGRAAVGGTLAVNQAAAALTSGGVYSGGFSAGKGQ